MAQARSNPPVVTPAMAAPLVHMPGEVSAMTLQHLKYRKDLADAGKYVGVPLGVPHVDQDLLPLLPGQLCTVMGRPGGGKTGFAIRWARWWASVLKANPETYANQYVALVSTEQTVEELSAFMAAASTQVAIDQMARGKINAVEWERLQRWSAERGSLPLIIVGRSEERRKARVPLRMDVVRQAFRYIEDTQGLSCSFVVLDWLQQLKPAQNFTYQAESKTIAVAENLAACKDLAVEMGCPWVVNVQARREVDRKDPPLPEADDGQWASAIEQDSDTMLAVVRPRKYKSPGEEFMGVLVEGDNQMLLSIIKQKMGPANLLKWLLYDPKYNKLEEAVENIVRLNPEMDRDEP